MVGAGVEAEQVRQWVAARAGGADTFRAPIIFSTDQGRGYGRSMSGVKLQCDGKRLAVAAL